MRVALVSMPWLTHDLPSAANGNLKSYISGAREDFEVSCFNAHSTLWSRIPKQYPKIAQTQWLGELLYAIHFFSNIEISSAIILIEKLFERSRRINTINDLDARFFDEFTQEYLNHLFDIIRSHRDDTATEISGFDVIGMTTSSFQVFSSLALAERLKELNPKVKIILGGSGTSLNPENWFRFFKQIDYIVIGEGEQRLLSLLDQISSDGHVTSTINGVTSRERLSKKIDRPSVNLSVHQGSHSVMPMPNYDEYAEFAEENNILWSIPLETSRGCSWDRRILHNDRFKSCYFCGIRQPPAKRSSKSPSQLVKESEQLSKRYKNTRLLFCDCEVENEHGMQWMDLLLRQKIGYLYKIDVRATVREKLLKSALQTGCIGIQIGIEGLSTKYLKRLNKGTTTIQNLSAMRNVFELGIPSYSNLLLEFPGAKEDEVKETADNIRRFAIVYEPLFLSLFELDAFSPIYHSPETFGISNIRLAEPLRKVFDREDMRSISLPWLDFDIKGSSVDWTPVIEARREWFALHKKLRDEIGFTERVRPLYYLDGSDFLEIIDRRNGFQVFTLDRLDRDVYLGCAKVISRAKLVTKFVKKGENASKIEDIIEQFLRYDLLFEEKNEILALAINRRPNLS